MTIVPKESVVALPLEKEIIQFTPSIVAFVGSPTVGKSTLAQAVTKKTNHIHLDVDSIRLEIFHRDHPIRLSKEEDREEMAASYRQMHERARKVISEGLPVLLTAVYSRDFHHEMLRMLAQETGVPLKVFYLETPSREEVEKRLADRRTRGSNSNVTLYEHFARVNEMYKLIEGVTVSRLPANLTIEEKVACVLASLKSLQMNE